MVANGAERSEPAALARSDPAGDAPVDYGRDLPDAWAKACKAAGIDPAIQAYVEPFLVQIQAWHTIEPDANMLHSVYPFVQNHKNLMTDRSFANGFILYVQYMLANAEEANRQPVVTASFRRQLAQYLAGFRSDIVQAFDIKDPEQEKSSDALMNHVAEAVYRQIEQYAADPLYPAFKHPMDEPDYAEYLKQNAPLPAYIPTLLSSDPEKRRPDATDTVQALAERLYNGMSVFILTHLSQIEVGKLAHPLMGHGIDTVMMRGPQAPENWPITLWLQGELRLDVLKTIGKEPRP